MGWYLPIRKKVACCWVTGNLSRTIPQDIKGNELDTGHSRFEACASGVLYLSICLSIMLLWLYPCKPCFHPQTYLIDCCLFYIYALLLYCMCLPGYIRQTCIIAPEVFDGIIIYRAHTWPYYLPCLLPANLVLILGTHWP